MNNTTMNKLIAIAFSVAMMSLTSCKKEDVEKNAEPFNSYLKIGETTYDINTDNLYYTLTDYYDGRTELSFAISDGVLNNQYGGNNFSEYEGATYFAKLYFLSAVGEPVNINNDFSINISYEQEGIENEQLGQIYLKLGDGWPHYSYEAFLDDTSISISGGTEIGDMMTIDFVGQLAFYYDAANHANYTAKTIELRIQAEVQDGVEY